VTGATPASTPDSRWWWEGAATGKLLIQRCAEGGRLRHPPVPACPRCRSLRWDTVVACGRGVVHSVTVLHHPQLPGFGYPLVVAVVELEEGTRLVSRRPAPLHGRREVISDRAAQQFGTEELLQFAWTLTFGVAGHLLATETLRLLRFNTAAGA
jgi:uncharacterized OB-fold protein